MKRRVSKIINIETITASGERWYFEHLKGSTQFLVYWLLNCPHLCYKLVTIITASVNRDIFPRTIRSSELSNNDQAWHQGHMAECVHCNRSQSLTQPQPQWSNTIKPTPHCLKLTPNLALARFSNTAQLRYKSVILSLFAPLTQYSIRDIDYLYHGIV